MSVVPPAKSKTVNSSISSLNSIDKNATAGVDYKSVKDDLVDSEPVPFKLYNWLFRRHLYRAQDMDAIATRRSVYDDPDIASHYWPKPEYENIHRFDVDARWTLREERALVRKIDWKVMLWAAISFSALNLDHFNLGNTVFRLAFLSAELPSQLISKRLGPDRWIPMQMCCWSIVTMGQFWITGRPSFLLCRALLGFIQGGFIPDLILYLSYFYTKHELPFRLALFWLSSNVCSIFGSFLAVGVLRMRGVQGKAGWRWLFLVEGLITLLVGIATFFKMPPSPTQTKSWFRPNGWFTEREEYIATSRILRDDPTKGDMHNREALSIKRLWKALWDYDLWPLYIVGLLFGIPASPPATYLTLSFRNLGFSTIHSNLLTIPSTVGAMITMVVITLASENFNDRSFVSMFEDVWLLPFLIALRTLPDKRNPWLQYGLSSVLLMYPYTHPIQVGWCSRNAGAVASRTVSASIYNMFVQASSVVAANIYRKDDAPLYRRGNSYLIAICTFNVIILYPGTKAYYLWRNKQRAKIWDAMTSGEKSEYLATTKDVGNRRLDFRFAH
ncbi:allantoate permease [Crassisporium funariophilum]|nr:allantoate permease [Crassisporium funariophilum]